MFTPPNVSHVTCRVSRVTCHVSRVTCHLSHVTCHLSPVLFYFKFLIYFFSLKNKFTKNIYFKKIRQNGGASRWMVCYQRGLPRLVLTVVCLSLKYLSLATITLMFQTIHRLFYCSSIDWLHGCKVLDSRAARNLPLNLSRNINFSTYDSRPH